MTDFAPQLFWIDAQREAMIAQVERWSRINSGSYHLEGLARMKAALAEDFTALGGEMRNVALAPMRSVGDDGAVRDIPLGEALVIRKRPNAKKQALLVGHYDTVFGKDHAFQTPRRVDENTLNGPGVADLKGGLSVMLHALLALEQSGVKDEIGWEIILNPDEEIGSPGSDALFKEAAPRHNFALIYEPAMADGSLVSHRKGSGNFTLLVHGRAAHAGRDFASGRNAVAALAECVTALYALNGQKDGVTVNPAILRGGSTVNTVPDLALCRFNVRIASEAEKQWVEAQLAAIQSRFAEREGFSLELHGHFTRPPKPVDPAQSSLHRAVAQCGETLGIPLGWKPSGGVCDGNNLQAYGLPNVDTMGVRGGEIHSDKEYVLLDSLTERAKLSALLLLQFAGGELCL